MDSSLALESSLGIETTVSLSFLSPGLPTLGTVSGEGEGEWDRESGRGEPVRRRCKGDVVGRREEEVTDEEGVAPVSSRISADSAVGDWFLDLLFLDICSLVRKLRSIARH